MVSITCDAAKCQRPTPSQHQHTLPPTAHSGHFRKTALVASVRTNRPWADFFAFSTRRRARWRATTPRAQAHGLAARASARTRRGRCFISASAVTAPRAPASAACTRAARAPMPGTCASRAPRRRCTPRARRTARGSRAAPCPPRRRAAACAFRNRVMEEIGASDEVCPLRRARASGADRLCQRGG
jgi:hypothetical protein